MNLAHFIDDCLLTEDIIDPRWETSRFYKLKLMKAKQAGKRYEQIISSILANSGQTVEKPLNTDHDRIINGKKKEMKGSMITKGTDDWFSFLQIRPAQDYDSIIFMAIYFDKVLLFELTKEEVQDRIDSGLFKKQHAYVMMQAVLQVFKKQVI